MLKVKFSGSLRQVAGRAEVSLPLPASRRLEDILASLSESYPGVLGQAADVQWRHGSSHVLVAVNGRVVDEGGGEAKGMLLSDGDEVTLLAPLGGGQTICCEERER